LFGDFLQTWLEYGGVLAACLVRKPAAATMALTVNGFCQVFVYGIHDPHLLYGFSGLGPDMVFALFRFRRYDVRAILLAGVTAGMFWYVVVWFTHGIFLYPLSFILPDLAIRVVGSALGDGLLAGALALGVLSLAGRNWNESRVVAFGDAGTGKIVDLTGLLLVSFGFLVIFLTNAFASVSNFFVGIGPKIPNEIPTQIPQTVEYNPGDVIGVLLVFLAATILAFWQLGSRYSYWA